MNEAKYIKSKVFKIMLAVMLSAFMSIGCGSSSGNSGNSAPDPKGAGFSENNNKNDTQPTPKAGSITGSVDLGTWPGFTNGISTEVEGHPESAVEVDEASGKFILSGIPEGEYDILVSGVDNMGQLHKKEFDGVVVVGGNVVDLGHFTLVKTGAISGMIELEDGANPIGSMVYIPGTNFGAWADENGYLTILYIPEGTYRMRFEHIGYAPAEFLDITVTRAQANDMGTITLLIDSDDDWIADISDNCIYVSNFDQIDTDGDLAGNACDNDDDNDGLTDLEEAEIGTDPLNPDTDGDLSLDGTDAFALDPLLWLFDTTTPELSIITPSDMDLLGSNNIFVEIFAEDTTGEPGEDISGLISVIVENTGTLEQWVAVDDGIFPDVTAGDSIYSSIVGAEPGDTVILQAFAKDFQGNQGTSNVVTVSINQAPVAVAGLDQVVYVGDFVQLDASASYDPEGYSLTYQWAQTSGPTVNLQGSDTSNPVFLATDIGVLKFNLTVNDGFIDATDIVRIEVYPSCSDPVNAGPNINSSAHEGSPIIEPVSGKLYFKSQRGGGYGSWDLWSAEKSGSGWDNLAPKLIVLH